MVTFLIQLRKGCTPVRDGTSLLMDTDDGDNGNFNTSVNDNETFDTNSLNDDTGDDNTDNNDPVPIPIIDESFDTIILINIPFPKYLMRTMPITYLRTTARMAIIRCHSKMTMMGTSNSKMI